MQLPSNDPAPRFRWLARCGPDLEVRLDFTPALLIAGLTGRLTSRSSRPLRSILYDAWTQRPARVLIDATGLASCDEPGLAALVEAIPNAVKASPPVAIAGLRSNQREFVHRYCADRVLKLRTFATSADAVDTLMAAPGAVVPDQATLLAEVRHLHRALISRSAIDQAKGMLMLVYGLDAEAAFAMLAWHSRKSRVPLRELTVRFLAAVRERPAGSLNPVTTDALLAEITANLMPAES